MARSLDRLRLNHQFPQLQLVKVLIACSPLTTQRRGGVVTTIEGQAPVPLMISEEAVEKLSDLLIAEADAQLGVRVAVRPGGCSGFSYEMYFDAAKEPSDQVITFGTLEVRVDPASAAMLSGARLHYTAGLQGSGFSFENPNAQRSCGCGKSFG
jgi:iron-sulfur cluster assembly protein/iron-sulfur cluster insertion protein